VRFDSTTGRYVAEMQLRNEGAAVGRTVAVVFEDLPAGVTLLDPDGTDDFGNAYVDMTTAIPAGGLQPGAVSQLLEIEVDNPGSLRFSLVTHVMVGEANRAPIFNAIGPLSVMPGAIWK
jgi:hypothetical protein